MPDQFPGLTLALKCLENFEKAIDPSIDGKTAIRMARESIQEAAAQMGKS